MAETSTSTPATTSSSPAPIIISSGGRKGLGVVEAALILAGLGGGYFFVLKPYLEKKRKEEAESKVGTDPNGQAATRIHEAITGFGTDIGGLRKAFNDIRDWAAVSEFYHRLYNTTIDEDLQGEKAISSELRSELNAIMKRSQAIAQNEYVHNPNPGSTYTSTVTTSVGKQEGIVPTVGDYVISIEDVCPVRKKPVIQGQASEVQAQGGLKSLKYFLYPLFKPFMEKPNNIIAVAKKNAKIGRLARAMPIPYIQDKDNALFFEVNALVAGDTTYTKTVTVYVSAKNVKLLHFKHEVDQWYAERTAEGSRATENTLFVEKPLYDSLKGAYDDLQGVPGWNADESMHVISIRPSKMFAYKSGVPAQIASNTIIGNPISTITDKSGKKFMYIRSMNGIIWIANAKDTRISKR